VDFTGIATAVVEGIRKQTGIKEFLLVGDSLGAGVLLADYPKLSADGKVRFVLISPTEPFSPEARQLVPLKNALLLANSKGDDFVRSPGFGKWIEGQRTAATVTGPIPPGHLILGENLSHVLLVKVLADFTSASHAPPSQPNSGTHPAASDDAPQAAPRAQEPDSLALDLSVPKPPTPKHWHWPHLSGGSYALGMPSQSKIQSLWGALQITTAQMDQLMALWQEVVINACNEDEKQFQPAVAKFALEREAILTPAQKVTRQRIVKYYADLTTRLKAQGLAGEELSLKAAEQARKDLPTLLTPQETDCWHTVENARQRATAEKAAK
jgi:hypothetical protein